MKRLFKKNQIIVTALALMIAAAGYLNYSGKLFHEKEDKGVQQANSELLDISESDLESSSKDIESQDKDADAKKDTAKETDGDVEGTPGEAVLTSGGLLTAKMYRMNRKKMPFSRCLILQKQQKKNLRQKQCLHQKGSVKQL